MQRKKQIKGRDANGIETVLRNECGFKIRKFKVGVAIPDGEFDMVLDPNDPSGLETGEIDEVDTIINYGKKLGFIVGAGAAFRACWWPERSRGPVRGPADALPDGSCR